MACSLRVEFLIGVLVGEQGGLLTGSLGDGCG